MRAGMGPRGLWTLGGMVSHVWSVVRRERGSHCSGGLQSSQRAAVAREGILPGGRGRPATGGAVLFMPTSAASAGRRLVPRAAW